MTEANTRPVWFRFLGWASREQFHVPASFGRFVMVFLIVFNEAFLGLVTIPRLGLLMSAMKVVMTSRPGRFLQVHPLICQEIAAAFALIAVWAWVRKRGRLLAVLFCCGLLQVGLVARTLTQVSFEHLTTKIHR